MHETRQSTFTSVLKLGKLIQEKKKRAIFFKRRTRQSTLTSSLKLRKIHSRKNEKYTEGIKEED